MKLRIALLPTLMALPCWPAAGAPAPEQAERIAATFALALGRLPSAEETREWAVRGNASVADMVARHRARLSADADARQAMAVAAWRDAFGRTPGDAEAHAAAGHGRTYFEQVIQHRRWLAEHTDDYRQVIERAYRLVVQRPPYPVEFDYWKARRTLTFTLLVGSIENWARRNAPGLTATSGVPAIAITCGFLATIRLSPAVAHEVRTGTGLVAAGEPERVAAMRLHVVAPGAEEIVSVGGVHLVAIGGDALAAL